MSHIYSGNAKNDLFGMYSRDIDRLSIPTKAEERDFFLKAKSGDPKAKSEFIGRHLPLAINIAKKFYARRSYRVDLMDLIQCGNLGLMNAFDYYNPDKKTRFCTYAYHCIIESMMRYIRQSSFICLTEATYRDKRKCDPVIGSNKRFVFNEVFKEAGLSAKRGKDIIGALVRVINFSSMKKSFNFGEGCKFDLAYDVIDDHKITLPFTEIERSDEVNNLRAVMRCLSSRERKILRMRFGLSGSAPHSFGEVSEKLGVTRQRIKQIECNALRKLKLSFDKRALICRKKSAQRIVMKPAHNKLQEVGS